jgi:DNA-binding SARP family transcriptional activator
LGSGGLGAAGIELDVLGPLQVRVASGPPAHVHGLGGRLLLVLAIDRGHAVCDDELFDRLWPDGPPTHAIASVRNHVARLRRSFGHAIVERDQRGYRFGAVRLDVDRFEAAVDAARRCRDDPSRAAELVDGALAAVRGRPFEDVADEIWAMPAAHGAAERIAAAEELWAELALASGTAYLDVTRLRRGATERPYREVRWVQLVAGLKALGHRTEALRAAGEARRALSELGLSPGADLVALERELVGADPELAVGARRVPARRDPMVGRDEHLADVLRRGRVVWVEGDAGVGKTRLLAEAADRFDANTVVLYAACPRSLGGSGLLAAMAGACGELVPRSAERTTDHAMRPDPDAWPAHVAERIVRSLRAAASERDVVVLADDVQWLDPAAAAATLDVIARTHADVHWVIASRPMDTHCAGVVLRGDLERAGALRRVALGPLAADDLVALCALLVPDLDDLARDDLAADILRATQGNPIAAAELIVHRQRAAAPNGEGPSRLESIVLGALAGLDAPGRHLVELLTVAGAPVPVVVLAGALGSAPMAVLELAEGLAADGLLAPVVDSVLDVRHEVVRQTIERQLNAADALARRQELIRHLVADGRQVVMLADQLVRGGDLLEPALAARIDAAVGAAIDRLMLEVEYRAAGDLAARYLDTTAGRSTGPEGLSTRLKAATALIAVGDVARGRPTLLRLLEQARESGDARVLADVILATGPLSTGRREQEQVLCDAERLARTLPLGDGSRRVQLACWAAHHRLLAGDRIRAVHLLDLADADPYGAAPSGQGLILAMRAQADTLVGPGPDAARRSLEELRRFAVAYGDPTADAAERLLAVREAWATGTLADVDAVRRRVAEMAVRMPRPDLRWWPQALEAAIELAAGRTESARAKVEAAARAGRELGVAAAAPTAMAQQLLLLLAEGRLAGAADALDQLAISADHSTQLLAGYGVACVEAGALDRAATVAARLARHPSLLEEAGASWPQVAMCASVIASATGSAPLATVLWRPLERFRGTGLSLHSVGYFGSADRCLGLLASVLGRCDEAEVLFLDAVAAEQRRGSALWERLAAADLDALRGDS